jgi:glucosyl-3-phosphoglycerate synthase
LTRKLKLLQKVLVPVIHGCDPKAALTIAHLLGQESEVVLTGIVGIPRGQSLSHGAAAAREIRSLIRSATSATVEKTRVSHDPWAELLHLVREEKPDLLVLDLPSFQALGQTQFETAFKEISCELALIRGNLPRKVNKILVPLRGGPFGELALRLALTFAHSTNAKIESIHVQSTQTWKTKLQRQTAKRRDAAYRGLERVLNNLPDIKKRKIDADNPADAIIAESTGQDMVIMGMTASRGKGFGRTATRILANNTGCVILVRTPVQQAAPSTEQAGQKAISVLVDKWFAENTYHADEFLDLKKLLKLKEQQNLRISLALPAMNEQATVGKVIRTVQNNFVKKVPIIDEIVLIDSGSTDRTRKIATDLNVPVYIHQELLPDHGARNGKGEALWKSLYVTTGDILIWMDTDIVNVHPRFIHGLLGPLLINPSLQFIKGFYQRPLRMGNKVSASGGGRVTELTARPLLNLLYPELSGVIQPLAGEYGGRRTALERLIFYSGYGVEIGLLIDVFEKFGLAAIGQVDLRQRVHHNQPLGALSLMSFAIIQVIMEKLGRREGSNLIEEVNKTMKLIQYGDERFYLDVKEINEKARPPMLALPEYRKLARAASTD